MAWYRERLTGFDLETTGTDVENDRIVTAALVTLASDGTAHAMRRWLLDPGVDIPEGAGAIHGISTEQARAHGIPAPDGIAQIAEAVAATLQGGEPLVVMNARYDLTLLDRECRRHGVPPLSDRLGEDPFPVIDPLVLDKHVDRYRKGRRNLQVLCAHYGVRLDTAHEAGADAVAAARVARSLGEHHPAIGIADLRELHKLQIWAAADQAASFQQYLRETTDPAARIEPAWPLVPYQRCPV
ncbi:3'-5' exonuclease [Streptomyces meridianus]|uniref:3'-5' exonuclease n=1 Tax=Streptomyces meridianus TaxID=2938945 RepID=A0ABT0X3N4_9ACTN|nr:3'-5' exonuclease [Streptomyces meridianus]MCM2576915.1 3'-5' exonuclease [Streptomyces meridianus]